MRCARSLLPATLLISLPLILYAPFLFGGQVLYWGVYWLQFFPWRQLAVEQIRAGQWPLWNPYLGAGTPLAANLQTATFYPPNVLFLLMPVEKAFGWELALHVALAGLFAYYLGRTLGLKRFGALVVGLVYGGGGYIVARWVFPSMVSAATWLPLMLALTERLICRAVSKQGRDIRGQVLGIALLALAIALQFLAGHAQTSFYSALIIATFAIVRVTHHTALHAHHATPGTQRRTQRVRIGVRSMVRLAMAAVWGIALAAIQLLPTAEFAARSQRAGNLSDLTFAFELSFWPWRLITLLAPDFFGNPARDEYWAFGTYWEESAFVGMLAFMLAIAALVSWWRGRRKQEDQGPLTLVPYFSILVVLSLLLALGDHTPLYPILFRYFPGFGLFQAPARLMLGYALGMALLAGIGAQTMRLTSRTRTVLRFALVGGLGATLAGISARWALPGIRTSFADSIVRLGLALALSAGVLLLRGRRLRGWRWQAAVIALIAADLFIFGYGLAPGTDPSVFHTPVSTAEFLQTQPEGRLFVAEPYAQKTYAQYVSLSSLGSAEPEHLQGLRESLISNLNTLHHLPGIGNYDPLTVGLYDDLHDILKGKPDAPLGLDEIRPVLNLFGARYIVTSEELDLPQIYDTVPRIYANDEALPAAFVVHRARVIEDETARLDALRTPTFDPHSEVILSHPPDLTLPPGSAGGEEEQVSISHRAPGLVTIDVELAQPGYLVLNDTYYPGWQATVNSVPVEILPANHAFRTVQLGEGQHDIVFKYTPFSFRLGVWITAGATLLVILALAIPWMRGRTRRGDRPPVGE